MAKRKIADCLNVRINVGNYQHIEITKYAEEEIEYSNEKERIQKEESLRDDLLTNLITSMKAIPERLSKGVQNAIEVQESIKKSIPEWLANGHVPNIANMAKAKELQVAAEQKENKDEHSKEIDIVNETFNKKSDSKPEIPEVDKLEGKDLFEEDSVPVISKETKADVVKDIATEASDDIFDDDIFGDK